MNSEREKTALGRFEIVCEKYLYGSDDDREIIMSFLDGDEKQTFLVGCGLYHLFTDDQFHRIVCSAIGNSIYNQLKIERGNKK